MKCSESFKVAVHRGQSLLAHVARLKSFLDSPVISCLKRSLQAWRHYMKRETLQVFAVDSKLLGIFHTHQCAVAELFICRACFRGRCRQAANEIADAGDWVFGFIGFGVHGFSGFKGCPPGCFARQKTGPVAASRRAPYPGRQRGKGVVSSPGAAAGAACILVAAADTAEQLPETSEGKHASVDDDHGHP
jgi:hypothetical protein